MNVEYFVLVSNGEIVSRGSGPIGSAARQNKPGVLSIPISRATYKDTSFLNLQADMSEAFPELREGIESASNLTELLSL